MEWRAPRVSAAVRSARARPPARRAPPSSRAPRRARRRRRCCRRDRPRRRGRTAARSDRRPMAGRSCSPGAGASGTVVNSGALLSKKTCHWLSAPLLTTSPVCTTGRASRRRRRRGCPSANVVSARRVADDGDAHRRAQRRRHQRARHRVDGGGEPVARVASLQVLPELTVVEVGRQRALLHRRAHQLRALGGQRARLGGGDVERVGAARHQPVDLDLVVHRPAAVVLLAVDDQPRRRHAIGLPGDAHRRRRRPQPIGRLASPARRCRPRPRRAPAPPGCRPARWSRGISSASTLCFCCNSDGNSRRSSVYGASSPAPIVHAEREAIVLVGRPVDAAARAHVVAEGLADVEQRAGARRQRDGEPAIAIDVAGDVEVGAQADAARRHRRHRQLRPSASSSRRSRCRRTSAGRRRPTRE